MPEAVLSRHWEVLGLPPGTSVEDLEIKYCLLLQQYPANPTEEQEQVWAEIRTAYSILHRACAPKEEKAPWVTKGLLVRVGVSAGVGILLGALILVAVNYRSLAVRWTEVEAGTELRLKNSDAPYGTVLAFEPSHVFPAGNPGPAYKVKLAGTGEEIWVGERVVELGMKR